MCYDYATPEAGTQITHSDVLEDETVELSIERLVNLGFYSARCALPAFERSDVRGFSDDEPRALDDFVHKNAPLILRLAREAS